MPGLIGRISTLIKAKISKLLDRAENPRIRPRRSTTHTSASSRICRT